MFVTLPTFFGPLVAIETDIRIGYEIRHRGHWEFRDTLEIIESFESHYKGQTGVMLDIGCNIGSWTLPLAQRYPKNSILAFDCQTVMLECVNQTKQMNRLDNIQTKWCALSDTCNVVSKPIIDYTWGVNFGAYEFEPPYHNSDFGCKTTQENMQLPVVTIDSLDLNRVVFMKLDIEGMELKALTGSVKTIQRDRPFIALEHHKTDRSAVEALLKTLDYRLLKTVGQMTVTIPN